MPYTFSHPGFSIWLKHKYLKRLSLNGLIVGSITPDFDILFRLNDSRFHLLDYHLWQILLLLLPITLLVSLYIHQVLKSVYIEVLPQSITAKFTSIFKLNYWLYLKNNFGIECLSFFIGICFHLFLDYITHWNAYYFMQACQILIYPNSSLQNFYYYFGWYFPQIIFTILGFYLLYKYCFSDFSLSSLLTEVKTFSKSSKIFWVSIIVCSLVYSFTKLALFGYEENFGWHYIIINCTTGFILSLFIIPVIYKTIFYKKQIE